MQALSIDAGLIRSLRVQPWRGQVHSVFERVVNLQEDRGALMTLASRDLDDAPDSLRVDVLQFSGAGLARGNRVTASSQAIAIGSLEIRIDGAAPWRSGLPVWPADPTRLRRNVAGLGALLDVTHRAADARDAVSVFDSTVVEVVRQRAALLCLSLRRGDRAAACAGARNLIGLGEGLTPSGDDFLVGLFTVLHLAGRPAPSCEDFCAAVLADVEFRTNAISATALKAAARGRVRERIQALLRALTTGTAKDLDTALPPVLAIGSTSGQWIVEGILSGFEAILPARFDAAGAA